MRACPLVCLANRWFAAGSSPCINDNATEQNAEDDLLFDECKDGNYVFFLILFSGVPLLQRGIAISFVLALNKYILTGWWLLHSVFCRRRKAVASPARQTQVSTGMIFVMLTFVRNPLLINYCLLYTSPSPRDLSTSRMPSSA